MLDLPPSLPRFKGLKDAVMERGGRPDDVLYVPVGGTTSGQGSYPSLEAALRQLLDDPEPPTALFFANDHIAFPGLQILQSWGVQIPRELSVVSFDDTPGLASQTRPALTSLRMPTLALGALAVQTLHQAITEPNLPFRRLRLPAELIVRESSGHAPGHSPVPRL
jgi:LacI family transcriptional regulator